MDSYSKYAKRNLLNYAGSLSNKTEVLSKDSYHDNPPKHSSGGRLYEVF